MVIILNIKVKQWIKINYFNKNIIKNINLIIKKYRDSYDREKYNKIYYEQHKEELQQYARMNHIRKKLLKLKNGQKPKPKHKKRIIKRV